MKKREKQISEIKRIVGEWGMFSINEVIGEESIVLNKTNKNSEIMIEKIAKDAVQCAEYVHGQEVNEYGIGYFELNDEQLSEVFRIAENYETDQLKTKKKCSTW